MKHRIPAYRYIVPVPSRREEDFQQVQQIIHGAVELWNPLYQTAYQTVVHQAKKTDCYRLLQPHDYQEIADEAFSRCYMQLERYQGRSRFAGWVCGYAKNITMNRCSKELTRRRNQQLLENAAKTRMLNRDPLWILIRLERDRCLWKSFFDLNVTDRRIIVLMVLENMAPRTIAHELHLTRKEVLTRHQAALNVLRWKFIRYDSMGGRDNSSYTG